MRARNAAAHLVLSLRRARRGARLELREEPPVVEPGRRVLGCGEEGVAHELQLLAQDGAEGRRVGAAREVHLREQL